LATHKGAIALCCGNSTRDDWLSSGNERFTIERGVEQGDVISPIFNAGLEHAMRKWKAKLFQHGVQLGHGSRLTNIRYASNAVCYFFK